MEKLNFNKVGFISDYSNGIRKWKCPRCNKEIYTKFNISKFIDEETFKNKPLVATCTYCFKTSILDSKE